MRFITLLVILGFLSSNLMGQSTDFKSFSDTVFWRVDAYAHDPMTDCKEHYFYHYFIGGDTTINELVYEKVIRPEVLIVTEGGDDPCYVWPWATFEGYMGAIREDTANKKVYYIMPDHEDQNLLYDYTLTVGDTLPPYLSNNMDILVNEVDSIWIHDGYRTRWNFNSEGPGYIIEGIGSQNGLIEQMEIGFAWPRLICVSDSINILFESDANSMIGCQVITNTESNAIQQQNLKIAPNPTRGVVQIASPTAFKNITIFNAFGDMIYQAPAATNQINLSGYPQGIYFLQVELYNGNMITEKIILAE